MPTAAPFASTSYFVFSVVVVVREPSPCWVVLLLASLLGELLTVLWVVSPFFMSVDVVLLDFWPSGCSVVVVLDEDCAKAAAVIAKLRPASTPNHLDGDFMFPPSSRAQDAPAGFRDVGKATGPATAFTGK